MPAFFSKKWPPFLLIAVATALVWGQTVKFEFVWDDNFFIRDLSSVRSLKHIPEMFYQLGAQATRPDDFVVFRPIRTAIYAVLCWLGGKAEPQPWIYHLANILGHGATAMMLLVTARLLLRRLSKNLSEIQVQIWAVVVALAFAVHPVVSEVVCWAKSLDDILAAFFTLAALREVLQPPENAAARWRAILFFALAVYSKESAVPFVFVLALIFLKIDGLPLKRAAQRAGQFFLVAAVYVVHRHLVIGRTSQTAPISGSYGQTLLDMLPVVLTYFRLLFGVPPFCIDYSYLPGGTHFFSPPVLGGFCLLAALAGGALLAWRSQRWRLAGFGLVWTGCFLLPVSNLVPMMQYLAERFLYLPLIGWLLAVAGLLAAFRPRPAVPIICVGVVLAWALTAWNRSWIWRDEITLFLRTSQENPKCARVESNAVAAVFHLPQILRAFKLENGNVSITDRIDPGSVDKVVATFTEALKYFPDNPHLLAALGMTLATTGQTGTAVPLFEKAAALDPENVEAWLNLARAELADNELDQSRAALAKVFALNPNNHFALAIQFECQWRAGDFPAALETARRWNRVAPDTNSAAALEKAEKKPAPAATPP
jgi:hypothetical protein